MTAPRAVGFAAMVAVASLCLVLSITRAGCQFGPGAADRMAGCAGSSVWLPAAILGSGLAAALGIVTAAVGSILRQALIHHRVSAALAGLARPGTLAGQAVRLVPGKWGPTVAGLRRPTIYCSEDLTARLDTDEIRAVLLHERHHQLAFDPVRLVVLAGLVPIVRHVPGGRSWLEMRRARVEIAADAYALRSGAGRPAIARALLKLAAAPPLGSLAGFATAHELRLQALVTGPPPVSVLRESWSSLRILSLALMAVAVICLIVPVG